MKKLLFVALAVLTIMSCQKNVDETAALQDVSFEAIALTPDVGLKAGNDVIDCKNDVPDYAAALISVGGVDTWYYPALFTLDSKLYTQSIKLPVGTYTVKEFFLYKNVVGTTGYEAGDNIVFATPLTGTQYAEYVSKPTTFTFPVEAFKKAQINIEVLCFQDHQYTSFGFNWFAVTEIVVREQCFFGDICFKHYDDYKDSHYANQAGGLKIDMPAIFRIDAYKNGQPLPAPYFSFTNDNEAAGWGVGAPVCVTYPDNLSVTETFTFELWIYVATGNTFGFVKFHTWTFKDAEMIEDQNNLPNDGVVDFVLGNCNLSAPDLQLAPYMNLPQTCTYQITGFNAPNSYVLATLAAFGTGYDISAGNCASYCGDEANSIYIGTTYPMNVYSSLYLPQAPAYIAGAFQWAKINWIINHLYMFPGYGWQDIQAATWMLQTPVKWDGLPQNGFPYTYANMTIAQAMVAGAANQGNFIPLPGGWACVIFASPQGQTIQTMFCLVDP